MESNVLNYFYAGRIYQFYLDNKEILIEGRNRDFGFLVPKKEGIEIAKLKRVVKGLVEKDGVTVKCSTLLKRRGWKFEFLVES